MFLVGQSAAMIAGVCGLEVPDDTRLLVFQADSSNPAGAQAHERLAPVLSFFEVTGDDDAIELCGKLLDYHGAGHTSNVHTQDPARVERFAAAMPTGRVLVNAPSSLGCAGLSTGLPPSLTLGCGTFGGNSTTDNVSYKNLLNIKRVAHARE
jgi:acetaldehyde dehydrogenase/alcohol dehydrogenase